MAVLCLPHHYWRRSIVVPASILLSIDSLLVSMAIVLFGVPSARAGTLCTAFMIGDGIGTFVGLSMHHPIGPAVLGAYLMILLIVTARVPWRYALWAPALCSLDNLLAGMAGRPSLGGIWIDSLTAALTSGLLALVGVAIAAAMVRSVPTRWIHYAVGAALVVAAICL